MNYCPYNEWRNVWCPYIKDDSNICSIRGQEKCETWRKAYIKNLKELFYKVIIGKNENE